MHICRKNIFERQNNGLNKKKERIVVPSGEEGGDVRGIERYASVYKVILY